MQLLTFCEFQVLCWKAGQASRIHNHSGSDCWMGVVQGPMIESLYCKMADGQVQCEAKHPSQPGMCPELRLERVATMMQGKVLYSPFFVNMTNAIDFLFFP